MKSNKKELLAAIIILLINVVTAALFLLFSFLIDYTGRISHFFLKVVLYFLICFAAFQIGRRVKSKIYKIIENIIYLPITFMAAFVTVAIPVMSIQLSIFLYLFLAFIVPLAFFRIDEYYHLTEIKLETWTYIILTSGVIFAFLFHRQIKFILHKAIPLLHQNSDRVKKFKLIELNNYVISVANIRLVIFFLYLTYAVVMNIMSFQGASYYDNQNIDKAVLQSFVTFIAFDRVLAAVKQIEFKPSELLDILKKSILDVYES